MDNHLNAYLNITVKTETKSQNEASPIVKPSSTISNMSSHDVSFTCNLTFSERLADTFCDENNEICMRSIFKKIESRGILLTDHRLSDAMDQINTFLTEKSTIYDSIFSLIITRSQFITIVDANIGIMTKIFTDSFIIPNFDIFRSEIKEMYENVKQNVTTGEVASYIPQLAKANGEHFGVAICTIDGQQYSIGDTDVDHSLQSCTKIVNYCIACEYQNSLNNETEGESVHKYVGREPSGVEFNSLQLDKSGKPHNPCVNAGAIMICSLIHKPQNAVNIDGNPDECGEADKFEYVCNIWKDLFAGQKIGFNNAVYLSERATGHRNYALDHFMMEQNPGFPVGTNLTQVLEFYFQCCSLEVTCSKLSLVAGTLANGGVNPLTSKRIFSHATVRNCLTVMYSCGMYDYSGEFAFKIGIPSKSGVGGAIISVIPNVMGIATFCPKLDGFGNSVRGVEMLTQLCQKFNFHHFDDLTMTDNSVSRKIDPRQPRMKKNTNGCKIKANAKYAADLSSATMKMITYASFGDAGALKRLYLKGFDLRGADYDHRTALHLAASNGHLNIVKYLYRVLDEHDLYPTDRWNNTPLDDAIRGNHTKVIKYIKMKMDIISEKA